MKVTIIISVISVVVIKISSIFYSVQDLANLLF